MSSAHRLFAWPLESQRTVFPLRASSSTTGVSPRRRRLALGSFLATFVVCLVVCAPAVSADPPTLSSIETDKDEITVFEQASVTAKADRSVYNSGYVIAMVEEGAGENICNASDTCWRTVSATWGQHQLDPKVASLHAEIRTIDGDVIERSESVEVVRYPRFFDVKLNYTSYECCGGYVVRNAVAESDPTIHWTGLELRVRNADGSLRCSTGSSDKCGSQVQIGDTVRATVEDWSGEQVFGASPYYTVTSDGLERLEADDIALVPLAARFSSVQALCEFVHTMPAYLKTNVVVPETSTSDQDEACLASEQAGHNVRLALKLIAATGGATAFLWYVAEDTAREQMPVEPVEGDPEPSRDPYPAPPIMNWHADDDDDGKPDIDEDAEELVRRNQDEFARRNMSEPRRLEAARKILKECRIRLGEYLKDVLTPIAQPGDCLDVPIFVSGDIDVREATDHDYASMLRFPIWFAQRYRSPENNPSPRGWYDNLEQCETKPAGTDCHEFPYFATEQGGEDARPRPRVKPVKSSHNRRQGALFGWFGKRCLNSPPEKEPVDGRPFLVLSAPRGSGLPTLQLCNRQ
jgi:hypothetical protein